MKMLVFALSEFSVPVIEKKEEENESRVWLSGPKWRESGEVKTTVSESDGALGAGRAAL